MIRLLFILTLSLVCSIGKAQYAWDVGGRLGFSNYLGEIGGGPGEARDWIYDMQLNQTRWNPGAFIRYRLNYNIAVRLEANYFRLQGADSLTENPQRYTRNLSFRNDIFELALLGEYYFINTPDVGRTGRYLIDFKAFIFTGAAVFYNNPKARLNGEWYALQPLQTEGNEYSRIQPSIPIGIGIMYTFSRVHRFGWSVSWRYTFTDYIDDVSTNYPDPSIFEDDEVAAQLSNRSMERANDPTSDDLVNFFREGAIRGNPESNDSYLLTAFSYSYVIRGNPRSFGKRRNYLYGGRRKSKVKRARF